ncbi:substrate-binding periplasmic protein [Pseudonocardia oroxyli]|uniref:ABC-type amino acid transport substrate-binding protein n=1 Tax=Pseudonocardia oroxyli TaxID=366584 RepID=A0A1G7Y280_PSEOR|nr:ABC transporter substrate-binding protein [Pseudonocardia oroxyli]SDG90521.1 ABC-type amino acid transport substrate-binding protein [Pseudonocardia oroxyli]
MSTRRKLLGGTLAAVAALVVAACGGGSTDQDTAAPPADTLRVGWAELAGYAHRDPATNQVEGLYIDLWQDIATHTGRQLELVEDTWPTLVLGVNAGKYDASIAGVTNERSQQVDFTSPIMQSDFTFAVKGGTVWQGIENLDRPGVKIAVTSGSNTDEALTKIVENAEIVRLRDVGGALLSLSSGSVDAMAGVRDYLGKSIVNNPDLTVLPSRFDVSTQAIFVRKDDSLLRSTMEAEARRLLSDGVVADKLAARGLVGVEAGKPVNG